MTGVYDIGRSFNAAEYWLLYLQNVLNVSCLIGNDNDNFITKAKLYELSDGNYSYYSEMPLIGKAGADLSVQYCADDFYGKKHILSAEAKLYDEMFSEYAMILAKDNPQILPYAMLYLESDTFSGDDRKSGVFFNLSGAFVKPVLPEVLRLQGLLQYGESLFKIMEAVKSVLLPWQFGFMYSRNEFSIRLVCYLADGGWDKLPAVLKKIGYEDIPEEDLSILTEFVNNKDVGVLVNLDVMQDGRIGDVLGVELSPVPTKIVDQQQWIVSEMMQSFITLVKSWNIADDRVDVIRDCIFSVGFQPQDMPAFFVTSGFSHFKLRWKKGKRLPVKAYMEINKS